MQCIHVQTGHIKTVSDAPVPMTDISISLTSVYGDWHICINALAEANQSLSTKMIKMNNIFRSKDDRTGLHDLEVISADGEANSSVEGWLYWLYEHRWLGCLFDQLFFWLATIFPPIVHFFPMPKAKKPTSYYIKPINPYRPLPNPSSGGDTGLVCKNKSCKTRPTHSTTYYESKHKHLVGVQVKWLLSAFTLGSNH
jgi:hypothetical protein